MFFLPRGSTSFCQKTAPLPCSLFNDQITIPSFPPSRTASAKTPIASGGNILSIGYFLMKVRCHSLKKQLIIFPSSPPHCCKQDCCKSPICQPFRGQAAATRHLCGKVEAGARKGAGCPSHSLVSSWCTGTDLQHRLLPREAGRAVETAPIDLTALHPPHLYTSYCWSELVDPDMALEEPGLDVEGGAGPGWEH